MDARLLMKHGILFAIGAYLLWGLLPLYWKLLQDVPSQEILAHRIAWSFACFFLYFLFWKRFRWLSRFRQQPATLLPWLATSILITSNWGIYIWAVNHGHIVETSLGYFMNPLMSVALGVLVLGEKLRRWQWVSAALASGGVLYLTFTYGQFPWIALALAITFSLYGLLKKRSALNAMQGMFIETAGVILPTSVYLLFLQSNGSASFLNSDLRTSSLLLFSGLFTALPLILFAAAAKRIPLSSLGLLQYIAPTLQFLIGVLVFHEAFDRQRLIGFSFIWLALLIFTADRFLNSLPRKKDTPSHT